MIDRIVGKSLVVLDASSTKAFNNKYYQSTLVPLRVMLAIGVLLYGVTFIGLDNALLPREAFRHLALIRIVISVAMVMVIGATYTSWFRKVWQGVVSISLIIAATGAGSVLYFIHPDDPYVNLISPTFVLFAMLAFTAFRLSLGWAAFTGFVQIVAFNVCAMDSGAVVGLALVGHDAVLGAAFLMGGVLNWELWRYERRDYMLIEQIGRERERSEQLLLNVLPGPVADRLKSGEDNIADAYPEATVLFADIVNFTELNVPADELVRFLNRIFTAFDALADKYELEKIKTIGDAYMVVASVPTPRKDHAEATARLGLEMLDTLHGLRKELGFPLEIRIGIHTGPLVAGVIGKRKFSFDIWGDTVNTASRMESHGVPGQVQISEAMYQKVAHLFDCKDRGFIHVKGKGTMHTYLIEGFKVSSRPKSGSETVGAVV
jgi:class 3 adenylate cyclase